MILNELYTLDDLRTYIKTVLSSQIWRLEGFEQTALVDTSITKALLLYSQRIPEIDWQIIQPYAGQFVFNPPIMGVYRVEFCDNSMFFSTTSVGLMQNMLGISSMQIAASGAGRLDAYQYWRKTWQRVSNQRPDYIFKPEIQTLLIYNPAAYTVCAIVLRPRTFDTIQLNHKVLFMNLSLAYATQQLGKARGKFGGTIQGPGGTVVTVDSKEMSSDGKDDVEKYEKELMDMQPRGLPAWE